MMNWMSWYRVCMKLDVSTRICAAYLLAVLVVGSRLFVCLVLIAFPPHHTAPGPESDREKCAQLHIQPALQKASGK